MHVLCPCLLAAVLAMPYCLCPRTHLGAQDADVPAADDLAHTNLHCTGRTWEDGYCQAADCGLCQMEGNARTK